ncbi:polymeric immunoglobulin receptor-like [Pungitius pungitius]|uniref:polymeric immunoglobulin receptor-like n=1 Tax=Pungitius pungitius TaxID=134920 RepID=UPI002E151FA6
MWSLRNQFFTLCLAVSCVRSAAGVIHAYGYERGEVQFPCHYQPGYESYEKYLCKEPCGWDEILIKTTQTDKNKYSQQDDRRNQVFTATIRNLSFADAGKYWCAVSVNGKDLYTEIKLEVLQDECCDRSTKVQSYEESSVSFSCPYESKYQNNLKYVCRGNHPSKCLQDAIITSNGNQTEQLQLTDDTVLRIFTVTMTELTRGQSGSYLCGVQVNTGLDVFSAFELQVKDWCCVTSINEIGIVGNQVTMRCPYPPGHRHNRKFLCRGEQRKKCTDMTYESRFTLREDMSSSSFLVIISELKAEDAGTYWCGSDPEWSADQYTKIHLSAVSKKQTTTLISTVTTMEPTSSQATVIPEKTFEASSLSVVSIVLPVLVTLAVAIIGVIVCKYKCSKVQGAGVDLNTNKTKADETEEAIEVANVYRNEDSAFSMQPPPRQLYDEAGETEQESVYQNYASTEDIYCNQDYIRALQDGQQ